MRKKSIFNALTRMKFFKHYANYKAFHFWRSNVRQSCSIRCARDHSSSVFGETTFARRHGISNIVHETTEVKIVNASPNHLYTLDEYAEQQTAQHAQRLPALESCCSAPRRCSKAGREVAAQAKLYQSIETRLWGGGQTGGSSFPGRAADKTRSMVAIKAERSIARGRIARSTRRRRCSANSPPWITCSSRHREAGGDDDGGAPRAVGGAQEKGTRRVAAAEEAEASRRPRVCSSRPSRSPRRRCRSRRLKKMSWRSLK